MFHIVEVTETFNNGGHVIKTEKHVIFSTKCPVEMLKRCYEIDPKGGYNVTIPHVRMKSYTYLDRMQDGAKICFSEIFRIVEGDEAFNAVMNDDNACVFEKEWVTAK